MDCSRVRLGTGNTVLFQEEEEVEEGEEEEESEKGGEGAVGTDQLFWMSTHSPQ